MRFVFYDLETTGTSAAFDQALQFAAIVTDIHFAEIERVNLRCQLAPHILPSPFALKVTGIAPSELHNPIYPSAFDFAQTIHAFTLKYAPAIWIGYNTLKFDEAFLRQLFYQNLQPSVYATQLGGNSRLDVMKCVHAVRVLDPDIFSWPINAKGRTSFRLEDLAPANGYSDHDAHDALGDVEATIHLARLIAQRSPDLWLELMQLADRVIVEEKIGSSNPLLHVERYGGGEPTGLPGCIIGYSEVSPRMAAFVNLEACDPVELNALDDQELDARLQKSPKVAKFIQTNAAPTLLSSAQINPVHLQRHSALKTMSSLRSRLIQWLDERLTANSSEPDLVELQIHSGFYSKGDQALLRAFQSQSWQERALSIRDFSDARLKTLGARLVNLYAPEHVDSVSKLQFLNECRTKLFTTAAVDWTTFDVAQKAITRLKEGEDTDSAFIGDLEEYFASRASHFEW